MITTQIFYFHDGILEPTDSLKIFGCSYLIVTYFNGIPIGSIILPPTP